jgi:transposase-like protein
MQRNQHSQEFREQALAKARERGNSTLEAVAKEINVSLGTLKGWLKRPRVAGAGNAGALELPSDLAAAQWSPAQRLQALCSTHGMTGPALAAWCREKGLFEHQLQHWQQSFCSMSAATSEASARHSQIQLRELQAKNATLQRDLSRKDRALAETAALLVLQKKFQALLEDVAK